MKSYYNVRVEADLIRRSVPISRKNHEHPDRKPIVSCDDWANSAFATTVMAGFFPIFFKQYWSQDVALTHGTFYLGVAILSQA